MICLIGDDDDGVLDSKLYPQRDISPVTVTVYGSIVCVHIYYMYVYWCVCVFGFL